MIQVKSLERTLTVLRERESEFALEFYERLFQKSPEFKTLFEGISIAEQGVNLMASLIIIVESQRQPNQLENYLHKLGIQHDGLGMQDEHFDVWIETMMEIMPKYCGSQWDEDADRAWLATFRYAAEIMLEAVETPHSPSSA